MESAQGNGAGYQSSRLTPGARRAQGLTSLTCELDFSVPASLVFGAVGVTATRRASGSPSGLLVLGAGRWVLLPLDAHGALLPGWAGVRGRWVLLPLDAHGALLPGWAGVSGRWVLLPLDAHGALLPGRWCCGRGRRWCYCHSTRMGLLLPGWGWRCRARWRVTATRRAWGPPSGAGLACRGAGCYCHSTRIGSSFRVAGGVRGVVGGCYCHSTRMGPPTWSLAVL